MQNRNMKVRVGERIGVRDAYASEKDYHLLGRSGLCRCLSVSLQKWPTLRS